MTGALLLVLEGLLLSLLAYDFARGLEFLGFWVRLLFALLAAACAALPCWPRRVPRPAHAPPITALGVTVLLMATLAIAIAHRCDGITSGWGAGTRMRLDRRAAILQEDFLAFLRALVSPLDHPPPAGADRTALFVHLARSVETSGLEPGRYGLSAYAADGALVAWAGNSSPPPARALEAAGPAHRFAIGGLGVQPRLFAARSDTASGLHLVAEYSLLPGATARHAGEITGLNLDILPRWQEVAPAHVHLSDPDDAADLARFFAGHADRDWGAPDRDAVQTVSFPLRVVSGEPVAIVSLRDRGPAQVTGPLRRKASRLAALIAAAGIVAAWVTALRTGWPAGSTRRLVAAAGAILAMRTALLLIGPAETLPDAAIFDVTLYSSTLLGPLSRSPADLLLSAVMFLALAALLRRGLRTWEPPPNPVGRRRAIGILAGLLVVLSALAAAGLHHLLDRLVVEARLDLTRVPLAPPEPAVLVLQIALYLLVVACGVVLAIPAGGLWRILRRADVEPGPPHRLWRAIGWIVVPTLVVAPFLQHAYERLRHEFFEDDLLPRVLEQAERRRQILQESLRAVSEPGIAAAAGFVSDGREGGGTEADALAYRLWRETPLAARGMASSVQVFEASGDRLGRFAVDLAPMLDVSFERAVAMAGRGLIDIPPDPGGPVRQRVLGGARWVRAAGRAAILVVLTLTDTYDNLPLLGAESVYLDLFRPPGTSRSNPELLRSPPMVSVFGEDLKRLYDASDPIPAPRAPLLERLQRNRPIWGVAEVGGAPARILYARGPEVIFALAHARSTPTATVAAWLRLALLNGVIVALASGFLAAGRLAIELRRPRLLPATFGRRLVLVLLVTGLVPLLSFAWVISRLIARDIDRELLASGLERLQVVRRLVEDYLEPSESGHPAVLDDDVIYWLSRVVRQDINVYREGMLLATSTRELYSTGILNMRLEGEAYRDLVLRRAPYTVTRTVSEPLRHLTVSMMSRIDRSGTPGVIGLPLAEQGRAAAAQQAEVEDALLIMTCLAAAALAAAGVAMGRRVAGPVSILARAARRVAEGDLQVRIPAAAGADETAVLIESFNTMAGSLQSQRDDLNRRREYIEKILRSATTGVISVDAAGTITTINPAAQGLLQGTRGAPEPGISWAGWIEADPGLRPLLEAWKGSGGPAEREVEIVVGTPERARRLRAVFIPFAVEEEAPWGRIVLLEDITEIVRSGQLAAWAEMARRVAHEVKNPLTPIQLSVEHVRRLMKGRDPRLGATLPECLDNIQRQVEALRQIATEFSAYARLPELRPAPVPVRDLLEETLGPYRVAPPPGIEVALDASPDLPEVVVDRAVVVRALVNLVENAIQAMPGGGRLVIGAAIVAGTPVDAGMVRVTVHDTGTGVDPDLLSRLFEPYFSTKSGGTGLGLALARKAIEEHGGTLDLRSRPGEGTTVIVTLPTGPGPEPS